MLFVLCSTAELNCCKRNHLGQPSKLTLSRKKIATPTLHHISQSQKQTVSGTIAMIALQGIFHSLPCLSEDQREPGVCRHALHGHIESMKSTWLRLFKCYLLPPAKFHII